MGQDKTVQVEVVVAFPEVQEIVDMVIPAGTTVREAVSRAQLTKYFPELDVQEKLHTSSTYLVFILYMVVF